MSLIDVTNLNLSLPNTQNVLHQTLTTDQSLKTYIKLTGVVHFVFQSLLCET